MQDESLPLSSPVDGEPEPIGTGIAEAPLIRDPPASESPPPKTPGRVSTRRAEGRGHPPGGNRRDQRKKRRWPAPVRWIVPLLATILLGLIGGVSVAALINIPSVEALADLSPGLITQLYDRSGGNLRSYFRERRVMLQEEEVPELVSQALVAMEDSSFFEHGGVDLRGVARAALTNFVEGSREEGASTLTMQLAGNVFLDRSQRNWSRKIREALMAVELEKRYSKQQILTLYLNLMNFSGGNYGIEAAAHDYFNKSAAELELQEAAALIAILPRPSDWSPRRKPELIRRRRDLVLARMLEVGFIDRAAYDAAVATPLLVVPHQRKAELGAYFNEEVRRSLYESYGEKGLYERGLQVYTTLDARAQLATEAALRRGLVRLDQLRGWRGPLQHLEGDPAAQELPSWKGLILEPGTWAQGIVLERSGSLATVQIGDRRFELEPEGYAWTRSSLARLLSPGDVAWFRLEGEEAPDTQRAPDDSQEDSDTSVAEIDLDLFLAQEPELEGAAVLIESATGAVRAMVGGWDYERNEFNRATQARRQVGSAFKPFVYGAALEMNYTPADTLFDAPCVFAGSDNLATYSPRNFYRQYYGIITLRRALEKSINVTAVKLLDMVTVDSVIDFARRAGVTSPLPPYPSLALGVAELSPLELAASYASFANNGFYVEPYLTERVTTPDGRILEQHQPRTIHSMEPDIAYLLTHMLEGVIDRGTGVSARSLDIDLAGKTGTTDGFTDAWFAGYSPSHTLVVWVGHDVKRSIGPKATGAEAALPVWREVMGRGLEEGWIPQGERFAIPPGIVQRPIEPGSGLLATPTSEAIVEAFRAGTEPTQGWDPGWEQILALPWYQQRAFYGIPKEGENMPEDIEDWTLVLDAREAAENPGTESEDAPAAEEE